jgi:hypothetical protein
MKKLLLALLAVSGMAFAAAPTPVYQYAETVTPGQNVVSVNKILAPCEVYGVVCPPAGLFDVVFTVTQTAEGPMTINANEVMGCISGSGRAGGSTCFTVVYTNITVVDAYGNQVGVVNGTDWSAADLPAGTYTYSTQVVSTAHRAPYPAYPGWIAYTQFTFQ